MKHFPFKILIICILLPPVLYILTVQTLETHLQKRYAREIEEIYIGDTAQLFQGSIRVEDAVNRNIDHYLQKKRLLQMGVRVKVTVTTRENTIIYPGVYAHDADVLPAPGDSDAVARENYRLLNEGLLVDVDLEIEPNRLLSNAILGGYILVFLAVLSFFYRAGARKAAFEEREKEVEIQRLVTLEKEYSRRLRDLDHERRQLSGEMALVKERLATEKEKVVQSEDEMLEEVVSLEEKLNLNIAQQEEQQQEIEALREKIEQYESGERKSRKHKDKAVDGAQKRFRTLYKNLTVNDRALKGFAGLTADLQLKAEEVIHQINEDPSLVTVKRKVFGKKNRETVLEVIFAYKGRLYFRNSKESGVEILSIGTKHTQAKDLSFLDNL